MTIKRLFCLAMLCMGTLTHTTGYSQNKGAAIFIGDSTCTLQCAFDKYYASSGSYLDTNCVAVCTFVKFHINSDGVPAGIEFNAGTPSFIKDYVTAFLSSTQKKWKSNDQQMQSGLLSGKELIQPFFFNLFSNSCKQVNTLKSAILDMLNFMELIPGKPYPPGLQNQPWFNGVLLKPLLVISPFS